jgi:hypothetical protein
MADYLPTFLFILLSAQYCLHFIEQVTTASDTAPGKDLSLLRK